MPLEYETRKQEPYFDSDEAEQSITVLFELLKKSDLGEIDQHYSVAIQMGIDAILMVQK